MPATAETPKRPPSVQQTENVRAELVAERMAVAPGEKLRIGLHQKIRPGWHTYWRNPGDSGLPTRLSWSLRDDARVGDTIWPAPERFSVGPIVNYGYGGEVVLLAPLEVPAAARPGEALTVLLRAEWLVCEEICIPEDAELSLTLQVSERSGAPSPAAALIAEFAARVPQPRGWTARYAAAGERVLLHVTGGDLSTRPIRDAYFFVATPDTIDHAASQPMIATADGLALALTPAASRRGRAIASLEGVIVATGPAGERVAAAIGATEAPLPAAVVEGFAAPALPLWQAVLFALLGGLLLNLMPCVLPVLSMKALAFVAHAHGERAARAREGFAYAAGVVASFLAIAAVVLALRAGGAELGWGFQFQSPVFVAVLAGVTLGVGLSLSGVFHLAGGRLVAYGDSLARRGGGVGAFFTGLLAVVVATPCTAPFMGAALGVALLAPAPTLVAILMAMGLGLALPFLALSLVPSATRLLPRPGPWMDRLKQILAFPMYATTAWLIWVLSQQVSPGSFAIVLGGLVAVAFAGWLYGVLSPERPTLARLAAAALIAVAAYLLADLEGAAPARAPGGPAGIGGSSEAFTADRLAALRGEGRPVFVNMTAAWCITCIVNERAALGGTSLRRHFESQRIAYLVGDWTQRDPAITAYLRSFGRGGVPLYVAYPARGGAPVVLPQLLTEAIVLDAFATR
ncbi:MAG: thioredoxin family protein [Alphaproteobacteria bacterium]|nr:thioredoxin family protein [Alphaproteobacteria bacterium]